MEKQIIPVFFATDDNYAPYLGAAIYSMLENASKDYFYNVHILTTQFNEENRAKINALQDDKSNIIFEDMSDVLVSYGEKLHTRHYYSVATYYRLFIAELFPQYDKGFYFDSDMIFLGDISELFNYDLKHNLIGGALEPVMQIPIFAAYTERVLNVPKDEYINAGMLLMDLKGLREFKLEEKFIKTLAIKTYTVAQDQDYINEILKNRILMLEDSWNLTASPDMVCDKPNIVHFKLNFRPWHYKGIPYEKEFWKYAEKSGYYEFLKNHYENYSFADRLNDKFVMEQLARAAMKDTLKACPELTMSDLVLDVDKLNPKG